MNIFNYTNTKDKTDNPLISIITITKNDKNNLESTICSVLSQTYNNIQYIIIDGNSTDGSKEIINKYKNKIDIIVSENDKGIYDAMNKGIENAYGEWIIFMNSSDFFSDNNILNTIFIDQKCKIVDDYNIIYSNFIFQYPDKKYFTIKPSPLNLLWQGQTISHQSVITRRKYLIENKFPISYKIAGDYFFLMNAYYNQVKFLYFDLSISVHKYGGISTNHQLLAIFEGWKIARKFENNRFFRVDLYYIKYYMKVVFRILKKFIKYDKKYY